MARNRMTKRDVAALARLVDRYGRDLIAAALKAKRGRGRPTDIDPLLRDVLRYGAVRAEMGANRKLSPSAAANRAAGKVRPKERTLRDAYARMERFFQDHPEFDWDNFWRVKTAAVKKQTAVLEQENEILRRNIAAQEKAAERQKAEIKHLEAEGKRLEAEDARLTADLKRLLEPFGLYHPYVIGRLSGEEDFILELLDALDVH
jgi:hypothetical protein